MPPPPAECAAALNSWCDANCPHFATHGPLVALFDTDARSGPPSWRCYAPSSLTADGARYLRGSTYCTRHRPLSQLLASCAPPSLAACVDARGEAAPCDAPPPPPAPPSPPPPPSPASSPQLRTPRGAPAARLEAWVQQCARGARCSCLVHGVSAWSLQLVANFTRVAFFVLPYDAAAADALAAAALANGWRHVHVLRAELQRRAPHPMRNPLLNPASRRLRALEALQVSNEFFDFQLLHADAGTGWLCAPSPADARSLLSLSAVLLLSLPAAECSARWRAALAAAAAPAAAQVEPIGAATEPSAHVVDAACGRGEAGEAAAACDVLLALGALRRLNAHHFSCSQVPPLHRRMYVMDLPRGGEGGGGGGGLVEGGEAAAEAEASLGHEEAWRKMRGAGSLLERGEAGGAEPASSAWRRRVPSLYRVRDEHKFGNPSGDFDFSDLASAWARRGKDLRFETGGLNVDTLLHLDVHPRLRLPLLQQFLSLPIGRDMMLWNIIVGAWGAYAIDQEGVLFSQGAVPWKQRMMPYCLSVQDCYERSLYAICGQPQIMGRPNTVPLADCVASTSAAVCPSSKPFPCPDGCRATFQECSRRAALPEEQLRRSTA
ncbi:hypothetical protein AB1Y20_010704 [Prymnesium parvum]|uniref:Uncharacterized protein n=1 Tax=Prymnesium parvum TaxID=97485 RepID=A0AB34IQ33_PRYPA